MTYHRVFIRSSIAGATEQELLTLPDHMIAPPPPPPPPVFSRVRVARSLAFCVLFCRSLFVLCCFTFGHCIVCTASNCPFGFFKLFFISINGQSNHEYPT